MTNLLLQTARLIDQTIDWIGRFVAWLVLVLVLLIIYDVAMRYLLQSGSIAIQEMQWHLFSVLFLLGAAYTLKDDEHVRMDLIYKCRFLTDRHRAWIDAIGALIILIPFCWLIIYCSKSFVEQSYIFNEGSPDPGGLSYRWIIKTMIPVGFGLLMLQAISEFIKKLLFAIRNDK